MDYNNPNQGKLKVTHLSQLPIEDSNPIHPSNAPKANYAIQQGPGEPQSGLKQSRGPVGVDTTYKPLDSHPNPYGTGERKAEIDFTQPVITAPMNDIPSTPLFHQIDESLQPNYIPPFPSTKRDYIQDYEQKRVPEIEKAAEEHRQQKHRLSKWETLLQTIQFPLLVALLYFVFQMPVFQHFLYKKIGFLPITQEDGQFNYNGLFLIAALFGLCVYFITNFTEFMASE
jgi:hypothetical protein